MADEIIRIPLLSAVLNPGKTVERVEVKQLDFAPSQQTGYHFHKCPVIGYISAGTINFQVEGGEPKVLNKGDAFFEPANTNIVHFDNASDSEGASFIAFYLLDKTEDELITMHE
ncbi:MAG: cupin domain-containing protein [Coxiellaceae bacterium]|nr:cupin domain-containing protein [Coxiellaceae bacterium]